MTKNLRNLDLAQLWFMEKVADGICVIFKENQKEKEKEKEKEKVEKKDKRRQDTKKTKKLGKKR